MQTECDIVPAGPDDYPELAQVWEASVAATHHFLMPEDFELFKSLIQRFFSHVEIAAARGGDGRIAGFVGVAEDKVEMLFIDPDCRGHGIGKMLLRHAMAAHGICKVDVNEQNEQAVGFYRHMGFEVVQRLAVDGMGKPYPLLCMQNFS